MGGKLTLSQPYPEHTPTPENKIKLINFLIDSSLDVYQRVTKILEKVDIRSRPSSKSVRKAIGNFKVEITNKTRR